MSSTHPNFTTQQPIASNKITDVYLAMQNSMNRQVIEKRLKSQFQSSSIIKQRFISDVTQIAKLNHQNIVQLIDFYPDTLSVYMEYINGENLSDYRKKYGNFSVGDALWITKQILEGLNYAHKNNVDHYDIQPKHIYITDSDTVKITGFSLANMIRMSHGEHQLQTDDLFEIQYVSPELIEEKAIDQRSDIYAVGIILYELLTGQTPFSGTPLQIAIKHANENPKSPSELNPQLDRNIDQLVLNAIQKNPNLRYKNAYDFIQAILSYVKHNPDRLGQVKFAQFVIPSVQTPDQPKTKFQSSLDASEAKAVVDQEVRTPNEKTSSKKRAGWLETIVWIGGITTLAVIVAGLMIVFFLSKKSTPTSETKTETPVAIPAKPDTNIIQDNTPASVPKLPTFDNKPPVAPPAPVTPTNDANKPASSTDATAKQNKKDKPLVDLNLSLEKPIETQQQGEQPAESHPQPKPKKEKSEGNVNDVLQGIQIPAKENSKKAPESDLEIINGR